MHPKETLLPKIFSKNTDKSSIWYGIRYLLNLKQNFTLKWKFLSSSAPYCNIIGSCCYFLISCLSENCWNSPASLPSLKLLGCDKWLADCGTGLKEQRDLAYVQWGACREAAGRHSRLPKQSWGHLGSKDWQRTSLGEDNTGFLAWDMCVCVFFFFSTATVFVAADFCINWCSSSLNKTLFQMRVY